MRDWKLPWVGGCRCGAVRFRVKQAPLITMACHCTGCRRMTASAFSLSVAVPTGGMTVTRGEAVPGGTQGPAVRHRHCAACKSWLFSQLEPDPGFVNVRATMLDDHGWFVPFIETQTVERLPWATTPALHGFERFPAMDALGPLIAAFASEGAGPG